MKKKKCKKGYRKKQNKCVKRDTYDDDDDYTGVNMIATMTAIGVADGIGTGLPP